MTAPRALMNLYAPPKSEVTSDAGIKQSPTGDWGLFDGKVWVRDGAKLPHICPFTAEEGDHLSFRRDKLRHIPYHLRYVPLGVLLTMRAADFFLPEIHNFRESANLCVIVAALLLFLMSTPCRVEYLSNPSIKFVSKRMRALGGALTLPGLVGLLLAANLTDESLLVGAAACTLIAGLILVLFSFCRKRLNLKKRNGDWFLLNGPSANYITRLERLLETTPQLEDSKLPSPNS